MKKRRRREYRGQERIEDAGGQLQTTQRRVAERSGRNEVNVLIGEREAEEEKKVMHLKSQPPCLPLSLSPAGPDKS